MYDVYISENSYLICQVVDDLIVKDLIQKFVFGNMFNF